MFSPLNVTTAQAQIILDRYLLTNKESIASLKELKNTGYSASTNTKSYHVSTPSCSCLLMVSSIETSSTHPISVETTSVLLSVIQSRTGIPLPEHRHLDITRALVPFPYLLLFPYPQGSIQTLSTVRAAGGLSPQQEAHLDIQLGAYFAQLHNIDNDWFGSPQKSTPVDPSYSWQDTFTTLLEGLIDQVESLYTQDELQLRYNDIRLYLSRAIGSFLFDDVEVPSLVWFTGSADDILIKLPSESTSGEVEISGILPNLSHAIWGDPLLETVFMPLGLSDAFLEGYESSGGGLLIQFPRQKTKRMWYTVYLALLVLVERKSNGDAENQKESWSRAVLKEYSVALKNAPCH